MPCAASRIALAIGLFQPGGKTPAGPRPVIASTILPSWSNTGAQKALMPGITEPTRARQAMLAGIRRPARRVRHA
jgi:hypothetical protein